MWRGAVTLVVRPIGSARSFHVNFMRSTRTLPLQPEKDPPVQHWLEPPTRVGVKNVRERSLLRFQDPPPRLWLFHDFVERMD